MASVKNALIGLSLAAGLAGGAVPAANADPAAAVRLTLAVDGPGDRPSLDQVQYVWGGRNYCWYGRGWHGPGWYWCGFAWRHGYGWGGGYGWRGWAWHGHGGWGHGYYGHGGGWHGGGFHGGGFHGGFHEGGFHHH